MNEDAVLYITILSAIVAVILSVINGRSEKSIGLCLFLFVTWTAVIWCALIAFVGISCAFYEKAFVERDTTFIFLHIVITVSLIGMTILSKGKTEHSKKIKAYVIAAILSINLIAFICSDLHINNDEVSTWSYYICTGRSSKVFHRKNNCKGLDNCKGTIETVTYSKAESLRRRPCRICKPQKPH